MPDALQSAGLLLVALLLVLLNGFFVAAEFALVKVRSTRIEELASQNRFGAKKALEAVRHLDAYLSATQLGITLASLALGYIGEPAMEHLLHPVLGFLPEQWRKTVAVVVGFSIITALHIVVGELAPKSLAIQKPEQTSLAVVYPLDFFYRVFKLPIAALNWTASITLRLFGLEPTSEHGGSGGEAHSENELRMILTASQAGGEIRESEVHLVNQVFNFAHQQAKEIMVPRTDVVFLSTGRSLEENVLNAERSGYTRFPLIDNASPDDVLGMIHIRELLRLWSRVREDAFDGNARAAGAQSDALRDLTRALPRVPETKPIDQLLREFQRGRQHMAVVVDEYGGTAGIVTLEDIVEEIVGDIQDEFDRTMPELEPVGEDCYAVDARMSLNKLERALGLEGPTEEPEVDTVGGWVLASAATGAVPVRVGESFPYGDATMTVLEMAGRRVRKVRVCVPESARGTLTNSSAEGPAASPGSAAEASEGVSRQQRTHS
jgi:CBS domain containing-hemolysin-like protein